MIWPEIAVVGIDGSGKTWLAHAIRILLGWNNVFVVWIKRGHGVIYVLSERFLNRHCPPICIVNPAGLRRRSPYTACHRRMIRVLPLLDYLSILVRAIALLPARLFRRVFVAERFLIDTLAYYYLLDRRIIYGVWFRVFTGIAARRKLIFLDAPLPVLIERRRDIEYSLEEIIRLRAFYRAAARMLDAPLIDTGRMGKKEVIRALHRILFGRPNGAGGKL